MTNKTQKAKKPQKVIRRWMRFYDIAAYIILSIDFLYSLGYIIYIGVIVSDWKMYLPYPHAQQWLELNSYSLLPPFCAIPASPLLIWQVKSRIELSDGDFYGIVGSMLGLGAISLFDASKSLQLYLARPSCSQDEYNSLRNAMQYGVEGITYTEWQYTLFMTKDGQTVELVFENLKDGYRVETSTGAVFLTSPDNRTLPSGGTWSPPYIADRGIRWWTHLIQNDLKCCGSKTFKEWDVFNGSIYYDDNPKNSIDKYGLYPPSCYCTYECPRNEIFREKCFNKCGNSGNPANQEILTKRPGCCKSYLNYLYNIYLETFVLTIILGLLYVVTICVYIVNYAATRTEVESLTQDDPTLALLETESEKFPAAAEQVNLSTESQKVQPSGDKTNGNQKVPHIHKVSNEVKGNKTGPKKKTASDPGIPHKKKKPT